MSVLFAAGEDEAFTLTAANVFTTGGTAFRTAYARCALQPTATAGVLHTFSGALATYLAAQPSGDKDFWYGYRFKGGGGFLTGQIAFQMFDGSKEFLRLISVVAANDVRLLLSPDGFTSVVVSYPASTIAQPTTAAEYVFRIKIHPTLGRIDWYINGGLWFTTGAMDTTGYCSGSPAKGQWGRANSNGDSYISEVRASSADDPCVGWAISTLVPSANGASTGWSGGYTTINEVTKDTSTLLTTASAATDATFVATDMAALSGPQVVRGVVLSGEFRAAASAPQHVDGLLRIGGTNYAAGQSQVAPAVAGPLQFIYETNPATGIAFTETAVDLAEIGVRSAA
jgi:hypothetical protein